MSEIIIAGAGIGGLVAAEKLSKAGLKVTVYEKQKKGEYHLDQIDAIDASAMEYAGIEIPEHYFAESNRITFVPCDPDAPSLTVPAKDDYRNLNVERREFYDFLTSRAVEAGAEFEYETEIKAPVILGNRIAGIETDKGRVYGDLIIDACGVHSPLRTAMPGFTFIENEPQQFDVLNAYRAYFDIVEDALKPETRYNLYLKDDGEVGLSWLVNEENSADSLIARFHKMDYSEVAGVLHRLSEDNPQMGTKLVRGGYFADIPVRQPLAVLVADGYAAIGDAAFMTYPVKGSGIAYSLKAGTILAGAVTDDKNGFFTAETLWEYESRFFKEIGFSACRIAIAKNLLPYLKAQELSDAFKSGLISTEELQAFFDNGLETVWKAKVFPFLKSKIQVLNDMPEFRSKLLDVAGWLGRFTALEPSFPSKYSYESVQKWAEKYNEFFNSIRMGASPNAVTKASEKIR